jgi:hypothetical protein
LRALAVLAVLLGQGPQGKAPSTWRLVSSECRGCELELPKVKSCPEASESEMTACFKGAREAAVRFHRQGGDLVYVSSRDGGVTQLRFAREDVCPAVFESTCPALPPRPREGCDGGEKKVCGGAEWMYGPPRQLSELCTSGSTYEICDGGARADFPERGERVICTRVDGARMSCMPEARWFDTISRP